LKGQRIGNGAEVVEKGSEHADKEENPELRGVG